jgi:hypothetical protein
MGAGGKWVFWGALINLSRLAVKARQRQQAQERAQTTYPPVRQPVRRTR